MLKMIRARLEDDRGFTLIELMVVVLIIAILLAIAIPTFLGLRQRAQDRAAQAELRDGLVAAKAFFTDDETYTGFLAEAPNIEPSLTWGAAGSTTTVGVVVENDDDVLLTQQSESDTWFAICDDNGTNKFGTGAAEAADMTDCQDASW